MDGGETLYLSREEAAELHKVSLPTIDRWIKIGGDQFVTEAGGNGRPYKIDAERLRAWRECRAVEEKEDEQKRRQLLAQHELALVGGATGDGAATGQGSTSGLSADQRIKLWQEQLLQNKVRQQAFKGLRAYQQSTV